MNEKNLAHKQEVVSEISEKFKSSTSSVVVEYRGLKVSEITDLRSKLRAEGIDFKVYKNKMAQRAATNEGFEELVEALTGPNAIAFSDDAVAPSRILAEFAKKNKALVLKSGIVEGKVVGVDTIKELASLPNRDGLLAMFIGMLQSPMRNFAYAVKQVSELEDREVATEGEAPAVEAVAEPAEETVAEASEEVKAEPVEDAAPVEETPAEETVEETVEETTETVETETKE